MNGGMMIRKSALALVLVAAATQPVAAQLPSASTPALGMGDNFTAAARGFSAVSWNPANLGLSGNPGSSFQFLTLRGLAGVDPVTLADVAEYQGKVVPNSVKTEWLARIEEEGNEAGNSGFEANWLSLQIGRVGFQASTTGNALAQFSPGIARLIMFGNTNEAGEPQTITLSGSNMDVNGYTTGALSYAQPFDLNNGASRLSIGVTAKYTIGHFMAIGQESTGSASADPLSVQLQFPVVHTPVSDEEGGFEAQSGSGFGIDVGVGFETGAWTFAGAVKNIMNSFEWDQDKLFFRQGQILFTDDERESDFDSQPLAGAPVPAALRARIDDMKFKPVIALGTNYRMSEKLRVTGDVRLGSDEGMITGPKTHAGAGVEYRVLSWLPVRLGAAYIAMNEENTGTQLGGGLGIDLGGFNLAASAGQRNTDHGKDTMVMLTIFARGN